MYKKSIPIIFKWFGALLFFLFLIIFIPKFKTIFFIGISNDASGISLSIACLFCLGSILSCFQMYAIHYENLSLNKIKHNLADIIDKKKNNSYCLNICSDIAELSKTGHETNLAILGETFHTRLHTKGKFTEMLSTMLITMGLIGTILGLVVVIGGLEAVIDNVGISRNNMLAGVQKTMSGMGTAFYTTLFGAFLGGVILRILQNINETELSKLCTNLLDFIELKLLPIYKGPKNIVLNKLQEEIDMLSLSMSKASEQILKTHNDMESLLKLPVHTQLENIAKNLQDCVTKITEINQ